MFRFRNRWQTSLGDAFTGRADPVATERLLAMLEERDRELEDAIDALSPTEWLDIGAAGAPAFGGTWTNYNVATHQRAGIRKSGDHVEIRGLVRSGSSGTAVFTLPEGYRPPGSLVFATPTDPNVFGRLDVEADGDVIVYLVGAGTSAYVSINCSFSVTP